MASTYLTRTGTTGTANYKMTYSAWFKRGNIGSGNELFCIYQSNSNRLFLRNNGDTFEFQISGQANSTTRQFRDTSAWYHLVIAVDTTQATASDRIKWYVNGEYISDGGSTIGQNTGLPHYSSGSNYYVGNGEYNSTPYTSYWDGLMAHVHFIDGTAYDADTFGETDATTGIWKPKTAPSVTYGNNGFFLKFASAGSLGTDSSGNGNNFTLSGSGTQTQDTPSNVFATMNPLDNYYPASTFSQGNTTITTATSNRSYNTGTLGASSGKYYWEVKAVSNVGSSNGCYIGIASTNPITNGISAPVQTLGYWQYDYAYVSGDGNYYTNNTSTSYGDTYTDNDIIGVALDLDNNKLYFSKNGTWQNSGDPTSGATGTGAISIGDPSGTVNGVYTPGLGDWWTSGFTVSFNFGNGYFGTTAVSSAQSPSDGIGLFEYSVPSGYKALCTKSINAQEYS